MIDHLTAHTTSRHDFMRVAVFLAQGLDKTLLTKKNQSTDVLILGTGGCGKSLVADAMIFELFDYFCTQEIPTSDKMSFEQRPVAAAKLPISITDDINGIPTDVYFFSDHRSISEHKNGKKDEIIPLQTTDTPRILFLSGILEPSRIKGDITIELRPQRDRWAITTGWSHQWRISINKAELKTENMLSALEKINTAYSNKLKFKRPIRAKSLVI
jgi:hypothetical protein